MTAQIIPLRGQKGDTPAKPSLDPILALTAPGMNAVNAVILDRMQSEIPLIPRWPGI
jgi:octaprenyl-diphosphate synthase